MWADKIGSKIINISDLDLYNEIDDVIALIKCLDLVVTTPNVNVHFAGAIGKNGQLDFSTSGSTTNVYQRLVVQTYVAVPV